MTKKKQRNTSWKIVAKRENNLLELLCTSGDAVWSDDFTVLIGSLNIETMSAKEWNIYFNNKKNEIEDIIQTKKIK